MTIAADEVNIPEVLRSCGSCIRATSRRWSENDVETLVAMFWASPEVMRLA